MNQILVAATLLVAIFSNGLTLAQDTDDRQPAVAPTLFLTGDPAKLPPGIERKPKIVLICGDDEYRSEEALPLLAQILAGQHGMDCTVSFSINSETNSVDPNYHFNNSGLEALADADAMILFTRFRQWPEAQMEMFEEYIKRGGPIVALRTATHPFDFPSDSESRFANWSWTSKTWPGGFGQQIIGDTWVSHHGDHKKESSVAVIAEGQQNNPILRGTGRLWSPTDVYGIAHLPKEATVLLRGEILSGMSSTDPPITDGRNQPMMPIAWTKSYQYDSGKEGKVFATTMFSSVDLKTEGIRRMIVNATYWALGWEDKIPDTATVNIPGDYHPTMFGFQKDPGFFSSQHLQPADYLVK